MKLEDQVTNFEISKQIKELGVEQYSQFYWVKSKAEIWHLCIYMRLSGNCYDIKNMQMVNKTNDIIISAFTATELGELLPRALVKDERIYYLKIDKDFRNDVLEWNIWYKCGDSYYHEVEKTEANARGKMLIMLLENNLITLESQI
jgi:hypothetical protein